MVYGDGAADSQRAIEVWSEYDLVCHFSKAGAECGEGSTPPAHLRPGDPQDTVARPDAGRGAPGEAPRAGAALERFIDAVVTARGADLVSPAAAAQACRILEAAYRAAKTGRWIALD
jgi:predicted dehydrogenase